MFFKRIFSLDGVGVLIKKNYPTSMPGSLEVLFNAVKDRR